MSAYLPFLLLGLGNGAVFGSLALALVVTYRSSQALNFATATMGLFSAYTYVYLRRGQLPVLLPWLPKTVDIGPDFWLIPAIIGALADPRTVQPFVLPGRLPAAAAGSAGGPSGGLCSG